MASRDGHGWPMPTGATTPAFPGPITTEEAADITEDATAAPTEHLPPGDQPLSPVIGSTAPGTATAPRSVDLDDPELQGRDRDVVARFMRLIVASEGLAVRDIRPTRIATNRFDLAAGVSAPLVGMELGRRSLTIRVMSATATDLVYLGIGPDAAQNGFPLYAGENLETQSTDEIWIVAASGNAGSVTVSTFREVLP